MFKKKEIESKMTIRNSNSGGENSTIDITAVILTLDEEQVIARCVRSLSWCKRVVVVDSGSSDSTVDNAKNSGAEIYVNKFESFGKQRNWSMENCSISTEWILFLDADEYCSLAFKDEVSKSITMESYTGYYCCNKTVLNGNWLKRCTRFPVWQYRITKLNGLKFKDVGHGQKELFKSDGIGYINSPYMHDAFYKGWADWFDKHNRYSTLEAEQRVKSKRSKGKSSSHSFDSVVFLKNTLTRLPMASLLRFIYTYFITLGFLDGKGSFTYSVNISIYEYLIRLKYKERMQKTNAK